MERARQCRRKVPPLAVLLAEREMSVYCSEEGLDPRAKLCRAGVFTSDLMCTCSLSLGLPDLTRLQLCASWVVVSIPVWSPYLCGKSRGICLDLACSMGGFMMGDLP